MEGKGMGNLLAQSPQAKKKIWPNYLAVMNS